MKILAGTVEKSDKNQSVVKNPKNEVSIDIGTAAHTDTKASQGSIHLLAELFQLITKMTPLEKVEWVLTQVLGIICCTFVLVYILVACAVSMVYLMIVYGASLFIVWLVVANIFGLY